MKNEIMIPTLKTAKIQVSSKNNDDNKIKAFNIDSIKNLAKINDILKKDSLKQEMNRQQQIHSGLDLVLMGDLTGSMSAYHSVLKSKFSEICDILFRIIPNLRIGIIFYLDHGSGDPYVTAVKKLTCNQNELQYFINSIEDGCGGDEDEAVEDALNDALEMNWNPFSKKSIVLMGDAGPHESNCCPHGYDYFITTKNLFNKGLVINSIYCQNTFQSIESLDSTEIGDFSRRIDPHDYGRFFSWIANVTGGISINVEHIDDIIDIIKAMAAKDAGKYEVFEAEVKNLSVRPIPALEHIKEKAKEIENRKKQLQIGFSA